jgi:hypothetical protein
MGQWRNGLVSGELALRSKARIVRHALRGISIEFVKLLARNLGLAKALVDAIVQLVRPVGELFAAVQVRFNGQLAEQRLKVAHALGTGQKLGQCCKVGARGLFVILGWRVGIRDGLQVN